MTHGALFRGARLAQTAEWAKTHEGDLNDLEREFLNASQAQVDADKRRRQRVVAGIVIGSLLFAVAMALLAFFANSLRIDAEAARNEADYARDAADASAAEARHQAGLALDAKATADANAADAVNAKATAQANLSLAQQKLDELKVEELLASARDKKAQLDREWSNCRLQRCGGGGDCKRQGAGRFQ